MASQVPVWASGSNPMANVACSDFTAFKAALLELRRDDDMIAHTLNDLARGTQEPRPDECARVFERLRAVYAQRHAAISQCLTETRADEARAHDAASANRDSADAKRALRLVQWRMDALESERDIEAITQARSVEALQAKCRGFKLPREATAGAGDKPAPTIYVPQ